MKRYSLANHILSITPNNSTLKWAFDTISIGGEGSYLDSISISLNGQLWSTTPFATGAWVHNKNLDKTGTVVLSLNQLSDEVKTFVTMAETYYADDYDGFTLTLTTNEGELICTCVDCYIQNIPSQDYQSSAQNQSWTFTCGKITFK